MSIETMDSGRRCVVTRVACDEGERRKLIELGIVPGVPIRKVSGKGAGPILVEVLGSRVAIGRSLASGVIVA